MFKILLISFIIFAVVKSVKKLISLKIYSSFLSLNKIKIRIISFLNKFITEIHYLIIEVQHC